MQFFKTLKWLFLIHVFISQKFLIKFIKNSTRILNKKQVQLLTELNIHAILYVHVNVASIRLHDQRNYSTVIERLKQIEDKKNNFIRNGIINGKSEKESWLSFNELITHSKSMQCNMFPKLKIFQTHNALQSVINIWKLWCVRKTWSVSVSFLCQK